MAAAIVLCCDYKQDKQPISQKRAQKDELEYTVGPAPAFATASFTQGSAVGGAGIAATKLVAGKK